MYNLFIPIELDHIKFTNAINKIKISNVCGFDKISPSMIKYVSDYFKKIVFLFF
jgi:hypothetical protein